MTLTQPPRHALACVLAACLVFGGCATVPESSPGSPPARPAEAQAATSSDSPAPAGAAASAPAAAPEAIAEVDATPAEPQPRGRLDPDQDAERHDLWVRIREGLRLPDLDNDLVRKWEQWYAGRPDYVQRMTERGARYLFHIVEEVDRRGLPTELALLPFIESAFNPEAMSNARAAGMWQFMPATGKDLELRQNVFRDDRRDVLASTRAALDYLEQLYQRFGDWHLALAAYNWGQGNVQRAVERNARARRPTDYQSLQRVPLETREYVPKLQAVKNIVLRPEAFGLALAPIDNHPYFLSVSIERDIDVVLATRLAGLEMDDFRQLNPQHNKPVILAAGTPQLLLPYDNANRFIRELAVHPGPLASWTAWVAPRALKPAEAARLTGMSEERLREVNRIPPRMVVKAGSTLLVPRGAHIEADVPEKVADNASIALTPEGPALRRVTFKAGRDGESVASVARRYRVSASQVALWNDVAAGARFAAGQPIVVMLPAASASKATRVVSTPPKAGARAPSRPPATRTPARVRVAER